MVVDDQFWEEVEQQWDLVGVFLVVVFVSDVKNFYIEFVVKLFNMLGKMVWYLFFGIVLFFGIIVFLFWKGDDVYNFLILVKWMVVLLVEKVLEEMFVVKD